MAELLERFILVCQGAFMNNRDSVRYASELLPASMAKVGVSWQGNPTVEANVVNCSAHGMRVTFPASLKPFQMPRKNDSVMVQIPKDQMGFAGMCVSVSNESDGSVSMRIHFHNPPERHQLKKILCESLKEKHRPGTFVKHEWEEIVDKLCSSDDQHLKGIGDKAKEMLVMREKIAKVHGNLTK